MTTETSPRVVLVVGGGSGLGRAIAQEFASLGARVYIASRRTALLQETAGKICEAGAQMIPVTTDVCDPVQVEALLDRIRQDCGHLDVLINAAGTFALGLSHETPVEVFDNLFDTNVRGPWLVSRAAIPLLSLSRNPSIINISSLAGVRAEQGMGVYEASKAALNSLTKVMAQELTHQRIRVNAIAPGPVDTGLYKGSFLGDDVASHLATPNDASLSMPFGRQGTAEEAARLAVFLASPESDFINGSIISLEGVMGY